MLARIEHEELEQFFRGCGWTPYFVEGDDPQQMHELMATTMDMVVEDIRRIQSHARSENDTTRPRWPMIVLKSPKGWTGPKFVDGLPVEGTFRAHQVPLLVDAEHPDHLQHLESWMRSYKPEELFDDNGRLLPELAELAPEGDRRMGANPHTNGGMLLKDLVMPDFHAHAVDVPAPGAVSGQDTLVLGKFLRDVAKLNQDQRNFRIFGPDETLFNLLGSVFEVTNRQWDGREVDNDEFLAPAGQVLDSMLSEHQCQGWLEGYLLTGRHGLFNSYEAFIRIVDSMFSQHAKWLKVTLELPWRRKIASLNYLLASHVWQQDHNGFTHQDPGFLDHVINKKADIVRCYLPPDANCLLSVFDYCLRSRHYVNVVVAGKHALPQWLTMDEAIVHCTEGVGIWQWASNDQNVEPDVVMACCGNTPTLEVLAAVSILRETLPDLKIRVINVVDLMKLQSASEHPHGLSETDYNCCSPRTSTSSLASMVKRFEAQGIPQTEERRRAYRELIVTTTGLSDCISGAILYDETIRQRLSNGTSFAKAVAAAGIIPGIKVDSGAKDLAAHPGEKITEGLDGLRDRLAEYAQMGARFAKWRAVIAIGDSLPSRGCIAANAHALARYSALCQESGLVPIVEPEVIMDGSHTLQRCAEATQQVLRTVFEQLNA